MRKSRRHILLVEDNRDVHQAFSALFAEVHDCSVHAVVRVRDALGLTGRRNVDAAIVDLAYGAETSARLNLIRTWRERGDSFPVIATSANDYEGLSVEALEAGADDFIRKPFRFGDLAARIDRLLRRGPAASAREPKLDGLKLPESAFVFAGALVHPDLRITMPDGRGEQLTPKQVGILHEFARHSGSVVVRNELVHAVWGADANTNSKSLDQYVYLLRKMFRESGIDLSEFVTPAARVGWHIAANATCATEGAVKT